MQCCLCMIDHTFSSKTVLDFRYAALYSLPSILPRREKKDWERRKESITSIVSAKVKTISSTFLTLFQRGRGWSANRHWEPVPGTAWAAPRKANPYSGPKFCKHGISKDRTPLFLYRRKLGGLILFELRQFRSLLCRKRIFLCWFCHV